MPLERAYHDPYFAYAFRYWRCQRAPGSNKSQSNFSSRRWRARIAGPASPGNTSKEIWARHLLQPFAVMWQPLERYPEQWPHLDVARLEHVVRAKLRLVYFSTQRFATNRFNWGLKQLWSGHRSCRPRKHRHCRMWRSHKCIRRHFDILSLNNQKAAVASIASHVLG